MIRKVIMRDWRDASTLMLVAKTSASAIPCTCACRHVPPPSDLGETLGYHTIFPDPDAKGYNYIDAHSPDPDVSIDFKTLMLTRSSKSKFMPNALVFPGGVVDESDKSSEWHQVFERVMGRSDLPPPPSSTQIPLERRPPMFSTPMFTPDESQSVEAQDLDLAFRICAIRETFEEMGILLVRDYGGSKRHVISGEELSIWRRFVHKNAENFRRLCEELNVVPDVWSLYEWSNWLTPIRFNVQHPSNKERGRDRNTRRFDTILYVVMLDEIPTADSYKEDAAEVVGAQWLNPFNALNMHYTASAWMAPPQIYEQARLLRFSNFDAIRRFAASRQQFSLARWLPVAVPTADGIASVLPGDSLYPSDPAYDFNRDEPPAFHGTLDDLRHNTSEHNRFEIRGANDVTLICNVESPNNHVMPLSLCQSKTPEAESEDV